MEVQERNLRIDQAHKIELLIKQLNMAQDELLKPLVDGLSFKSDDELEQLARELPAGFYRTECSVILRQRRGGWL